MPDFADRLAARIRELRQSPATARQTDWSTMALTQGRCLGDGIVDYTPRDLTITVQSGITMGVLAQQLHRESQWLPLDYAPAEITLRDLFDCNFYGPLSTGYGQLRDYVLGVRAVDGTGTVFSSGGRVVKNVAGYDLSRLLIGAEGRFGVVSEMTLKVLPQPKTLHAGFFACRPEHLPELVNDLRTRERRPVTAHVLNAAAVNQWMPQSSRSELLDGEVLLCCEWHGIFPEGDACPMTQCPSTGRLVAEHRCAFGQSESDDPPWRSAVATAGLTASDASTASDHDHGPFSFDEWHCKASQVASIVRAVAVSDTPVAGPAFGGKFIAAITDQLPPRLASMRAAGEVLHYRVNGPDARNPIRHTRVRQHASAAGGELLLRERLFRTLDPDAVFSSSTALTESSE